MAGLFSDNELRLAVLGYTNKYAQGAANNPIGKSYKEFTASDIERLPVPDLLSLRNMSREKKFSITNPMLPSHMGPVDFHRAVLRALYKQNVVQNVYSGVEDPDRKITSLLGRTVEVERARQIPGVERGPEKVTEAANVVHLRDGFLSVVFNNKSDFRLQDDVVKALGLRQPKQGRAYVVTLENDLEEYDLGYTAGVLPNFRVDNGLFMQLKLQITPQQQAELEQRVGIPLAKMSEDQLAKLSPETKNLINQVSNQFNQANYCGTAEKLEQSARTVVPSTAALAGYAQGRVDAASKGPGAGRSYDRIGLFADCPRR